MLRAATEGKAGRSFLSDRFDPRRASRGLISSWRTCLINPGIKVSSLISMTADIFSKFSVLDGICDRPEAAAGRAFLATGSGEHLSRLGPLPIDRDALAL